MRVTILTTGGTIDKTYSEFDGTLRNARSVLEEILSTLRLPDLFIRHVAVMAVDSLDMTLDDRHRILRAVEDAIPSSDAVMVLHGTDTLSTTGELLHEELKGLRIPVVLTGAMRPYEFRDSDALQNVTETLIAARLLGPGVHAVMHNKVLHFPGVYKDRRTLTFRSDGERGGGRRE
jgi:L-asparaginase